MSYLTHLAKNAGVHGANATIDEDRWTNDFLERDGRPLPGMSVEWNADVERWWVFFGDEMGPEYSQPFSAFDWLRGAVAAYQFPVCARCDDTGIERWAVGDVEHSDACECWHGQRKLKEADNV